MRKLTMHTEDLGFISFTNTHAEIEKFFINGNLPSEGAALELVVVKKEDSEGLCSLVMKFRPVQD